MTRPVKIKTEVTVKLASKGERKPQHRFYKMFNNLKSGAIELAREIEGDERQDAPNDVVFFLDMFGR
jgi:hypothetical protein